MRRRKKGQGTGDYKVHFATRRRTRDPKTGKGEPSKTHNQPLLFNVKKDIGESRNIAAEHPEIVERLTREFQQARAATANWKKLPG